VYLRRSEFEVGEVGKAVGEREVVLDQGQGAGRVVFGNKEVRCEGGAEVWKLFPFLPSRNSRAKRAWGWIWWGRVCTQVISIKEK
jgi:hypothetical protein